jgi:hypothetical protein
MADRAAATVYAPTRVALSTLSWLWVALPFLYGVWELLIKVVPLFSR